MNRILFATLIVLAGSSPALAQWQLMHPYPQGSEITSMQFLDQYTGWFTVANGAIWKTQDGGVTWTMQRASAYSRLNSVKFLNSLRGYAGGEDNTWLWTSDGGSHWIAAVNPPPYFTRGITRIELGRFGTPYAGTTNGSIYVSIPSEQGWGRKFQWPEELDGDYWRPPGPVVGLSIVDSTVIWALGRRQINLARRGNLIVRSTDAGTSWDSVRVDIPGRVTDIHFASRGRGWYLGDSASIIGTRDNGASWATEFRGVAFSGNPLNDICGVDSVLACAVGEHGLVVRTLNGGDTWLPSRVDSSVTLTSVCFVDRLIGYAGGKSGEIFKTTNSGTSWTRISVGRPYYFKAVDFVSPRRGWAIVVPGWGAAGGLFRTDDSGHTWQHEPAFAGTYLTDIEMIDDQQGYILASSYPTRVYTTTDGGISWSATPASVVDGEQGIVFLDAQRGWIFGGRESGSYRQVVHRTTNAGITWSVAAIDTPEFQSSVLDLCFLGSQLVWCVNQYGVYKSTDGGAQWSHIYFTSGSTMFQSVSFVDELHGWIAGIGGMVSVTTDGGATWQPQTSGTRTQLQKIRFINAQRGWAIGLGDIISTTDGGTHWTVESLSTKEWLLDHSFVTEGNTFSLWACGYNGTILRLKDQLTGVENPGGTNTASEYRLFQNYPNPFNPTTTIDFSVGTYGHTSLRVYDLLGREVATLLNEEKSPGDYTVTWDPKGVASGVYLYRLQAGDFVATKKTLLLR